jgi:hypothetical protein
MASFVLELPPQVAERLADRSREEVTRFIVDAVTAALDEEEGEEGFDDTPPALTPEDVEALRRSLASADAGRLLDGNEVMAALYARAGLTTSVAAKEEDTFYHDPHAELSPEDMEALGRSLTDGDAGRVQDGDEVFAELYAHVGLTFYGKPEPLNYRNQ